MRNTTKLKTLLKKYTVTFDINDDDVFVLLLSDKFSNDTIEFEGKTYSIVVSKAFSHLLRILKPD